MKVFSSCLRKIVTIAGLFVCLTSSVQVGASLPDICNDPDTVCTAYAITNTAVLWLPDYINNTISLNTPDPGYALDFNITDRGTTYNFSVVATRGTGTDYAEMQAFHNRHKNSTVHRYVDAPIYRGIGNVQLPGVVMNYESFGITTSTYRSGAAAIDNQCGIQYTFEIFADGPYGTWGEGFGSIISGMDYGAC